MASAYLLFNVGTFLSAVFLIKKYRLTIKWLRVLIGYLLVSVPFIIWDIFAARYGHWDFNAAYTLGGRLGGIAVEEIIFFFTVPLVCLAIFLIVKNKVSPTFRAGPALLAALGLVAAAISLVWFDHGYTFTVSVVGVAACVLLLAQSTLIHLKAFWIFQLILLGVFIVANTFLTALPVITYGEQAIIGLRIGTIPVEDFLYNFSLINLFLLIYRWKEK